MADQDHRPAGAADRRSRPWRLADRFRRDRRPSGWQPPGAPAGGAGAAGSLARLAGRFRRQARGAIAVEAALIVPVFVTLVVGAFDFGMAYVDGLRLSAAARAGTQQALYDPKVWEDASLMELTALSEFTGSAVTADTRAALTVTARSRAFCGCADGSELLCTSTCAGGAEPSRYVAVTLTDDHMLTIDWPFVDGRTLQLARQSVVRVR